MRQRSRLRANLPQLSRLRILQRLEDPRYDWPKVNHAVRRCQKNEYGDSELCNVLLEFEVAIHRHQHLEPPLHTAQKLTVLDPLPA